MCRFSLVLTIVAIGASSFALESPPRVRAKHATPRNNTRTEIGVGYLNWNEQFRIHDASHQVSGVASYGGPALYVEQDWLVKRWQFGAKLLLGSGKASAMASGAITYSDGTNRSWTSIMIEPFAHYFINNYVSVGAGLLYRYVNITWDSADSSIVLDPTYKSVTGQIDFKIRLNSHWSLGQSYAPMDFAGKSQWFTSAGYIF